MNYTNDQLKQALAKMLPDKVYHGGEMDQDDDLRWKDRMFVNTVLDTELLHLCWMVEETLNREASRAYTLELHPKYINHLSADWCILHATWQQRVIALCKVKGIEI